MKHVSGFKDAEKLLQQLPQNVENRVLQAATMAGARVLAKNVKVRAPRSSGKRSKASLKYRQLFKNIRTVRLKNARKRGQRGARVDTGNAFWGLFPEFGTRYITARPWFRPAVTEAQDAALDKLREALARGIDREATKLAKRAGVR